MSRTFRGDPTAGEARPVSGRRCARESSESAADPVDDETAVVIGRLLPREVAGIERVDLAVGQQVGEVFVVGPGHEVVVASGDDLGHFALFEAAIEQGKNASALKTKLAKVLEPASGV